jgi:Fe-S oxidoreductase
MAWERRASPVGFPSLLWSIYWNNNPWSQPPSQRSIWAKDLDLPTYDPARHEILLYVGCTSSYDRRAQQIAKAIVLMFREAGVSFGVLKEDEPCCGEAALSIGHKQYYLEVAEHAAKILHENGVDRLVTVSPHCFNALKNENPYFGDEVRVDHYTSYAAELIEAGRLSFKAGLQGTVTYHDPCYLARRNQEIDAPRRILNSIPGLNVVEMKRSGKNTLCCGAGGGRMWLETEPGQRFSDLRIQEAKQTGASILATACPFCLSCLEDSLKGMRMDDISVLDLAEIVALSFQEPVVQEDAADG